MEPVTTAAIPVAMRMYCDMQIHKAWIDDLCSLGGLAIVMGVLLLIAYLTTRNG